jgi:hypothetical protein
MRFPNTIWLVPIHLPHMFIGPNGTVLLRLRTQVQTELPGQTQKISYLLKVKYAVFFPFSILQILKKELLSSICSNTKPNGAGQMD